jgi:hypothetical protein
VKKPIPELIAEIERLLQALKEAIADSRELRHEKSSRAGGVITNRTASDLYDTPVRQFDDQPVPVDPNLGSL